MNALEWILVGIISNFVLTILCAAVLFKKMDKLLKAHNEEW